MKVEAKITLLADSTNAVKALANITIDAEKCIKCGACIERCKFGAISIK